MSVEVVVGILIAWAAGKATRVGAKFDKLADEALDLGAERVREIVLDKLGANAAVLRLLDEACETGGSVSDTTRAAAEQAVADAVRRDDGFAAALREASPRAAGAGSRGDTRVNKGVQNITASGGSKINIRNKVVDQVVNQYNKNPVATVAVGLVLVVVLLLGGAGLISGVGDVVSVQDAGSDTAAVDSGSIVGTWNASDGTGVKTFSVDGGPCDGFWPVPGNATTR